MEIPNHTVLRESWIQKKKEILLVHLRISPLSSKSMITLCYSFNYFYLQKILLQFCPNHEGI